MVRIELGRAEGDLVPSAGVIVLTAEVDEHAELKGGSSSVIPDYLTGFYFPVSSAVVRIYNGEHGDCLCVDEEQEAQSKWRES